MTSAQPDALLTDVTGYVADYVTDYAVGASSINAARLCLVDAIACALDARVDARTGRDIGLEIVDLLRRESAVARCRSRGSRR